MPQRDILRQYIDSGLAVTAMTQARAEAFVKELVRSGEVQASQAREVAADLLERSRKNSEKLLSTIRREVREQITTLGLVTKEDLDRAEERLSAVVDAATAPIRRAAGQAAPAKTASTKKAPTKKAPAKKAPAKKAPAKTASTKKAAAKKAPAKKAAPRPDSSSGPAGTEG